MLADALALPPHADVLATLPPPDPAVLRGARVGDAYILMDGMGPGEAVGVLCAVGEATELELIDALGITQRVWLGPDGTSHLGRWYVVRRATHPVDELAALALGVRSYPTGVTPVATRILGTAFFPGGSGLWRPDRRLPAFPGGGVLVVGHDFGTVAQYATALRAGSEPVERNPTWRSLRTSFEAAGIPVGECFFTNAYLGLRDAGSPTGAFPGRRDEAFQDACLAVLNRTIALQRPRLIITLGRYVPALLARLSPSALAGWLSAQTFAAIDAVDALQRNVPFADGHRATVVALTHPSMAAANAHRRTGVDLLAAAYAR